MDEETKVQSEAVETTDENTEEQENLAAKLAEKEAKLAELEKEVAGYKDKDLNFKRLREKKLKDLSEEEIEKLSDQEKILRERQEQLEDEQISFRKQITDSFKDEAMAVLAGENKSLREKMLHHFDRIKDSENATTKEEINTLMKEAYLLAEGKPASINPINRAMAYEGGQGVAKAKTSLSSEQKDLAAKLGITNEDIEQYEQKRK